ncbi:MAG: serine/threonine protein kinase [Planctomycetales bacterium]|nr:serine/threonine protein kinase [Planctomycetales bacterium]
MSAAATGEEKLFGQIVVKNRLATAEQVERVFQQMRDMERGGVSMVSLGEMFVMEGILTQKQVDAVEDLRRMLVRSRAAKEVGGYVLKRKIGEGGMGQVYEAYQPALDRKVAIKVLPRELVEDAAMVRRFEREAQAAASLNHENIIPVYAFGRMGDEYYLVMEYVDGQNLEEILEKKGRISERTALKIAGQIARALKYAHSRGLTHRDLKPNNVMITRDGRAKLADLGLAKRLDGAAGHITQTGVIVGTPAFMAPEQITNPKGVDLRTDIYGLGVTLYCMLTGLTPFETRTTMEVVHDLVAGKSPIPDKMDGLSPPLQAIIRRMTAPDPADRYPDSDSVLEAIQRLQGAPGKGAGTGAAGAGETPSGEARLLETGPLLRNLVGTAWQKRKGWVIAGTAGLLALIAVVVWLLAR